MKKWTISLLVFVIFIPLFLSCNAKSTEQNAKSTSLNSANQNVCVVFDSENPILIQPHLSAIKNLLKTYEIDMNAIDLAGMDYTEFTNHFDESTYSGMVICLPYDFGIDVMLNEIHGSNFGIIQFGGDYYPNDISASVHNEHIGYLMGKKMGETFIKRDNHMPKIGFYSVENEWKKIEQGFIKGLSETIPKAYVSGRRIVSSDGSTYYVNGLEDDDALDGVCAFFCDTSSKHIAYSDNTIQARVSVGQNNERTDNTVISLVVRDEGTSMEAIAQFSEMLKGNRTTRTEFVYEAVFEYAL